MSTLPPETDPAGLEATLAEIRSALGADAVLTGEAGHEFRDPYDGFDEAHFPSAVVQPTTVEEVQAVVRIAAARGIPIWTSSQGRNNGYGGSAPVVGGSVVLSLRKMNRILEIDDELGIAVVEPGVQFFELVDELRRRGGRWWTATPSLGWGSVVGNTLDHGFGYTEYGDHAAHVPALEVVLADGSLLRTGMWASSTSRAAHPRGFGPNLTPLFMQSNLGIVTKLARPLSPRPEIYAPITIRVPDAEDLGPLVDVMRVLTIEGTIPNIPNITSALGAASMRKPRRDWYDGPVPIPDDVYRDMCETLGIGWWNCAAALYGPAAVVAARLERVREVVLKALPRAEVSAKLLQGGEIDDGVLTHRESVQAGRPSLVMLATAKWRGDEGGHLEISPIGPATGADVERIVAILRPIVEAEGFDFWPSVYVIKRSLMFLGVLNFDRFDPSQIEAAYRVARVAYPALAAAGYTPYRGNIRFMDMMQDIYDWNDHAMRRFVERLKDELDPVGILSPGKQGIWPRRLRAERDGSSAPHEHEPTRSRMKEDNQ
ncbi:FAD-binding oxidoreductase [Microbacterium terregens]|uniref:FAD-binding oxidoreductase n=1 Tax=Microbacterium terregens TaxID=69363 RepID=A0ABV5T267_9MICO